MLLTPPTSTLFPYTTLFRSSRSPRRGRWGDRRVPHPWPVDLTLTPAQLELQARARSFVREALWPVEAELERDRKSTRLNSSHSQISYAVFCLKKKKEYIQVK